MVMVEAVGLVLVVGGGRNVVDRRRGEDTDRAE